MTQKNETQIVILSLIATITLIFGGSWFLIERWAQINKSAVNNTANSSSSNPKNSSQNLIGSHHSPSNCNVSNLPQGTFSYGGSTTWAPIRRDVDSELQKNCSQFVLRYTQPTNEKPGSGTGIKMLIANQLAFAQSSRSIKPEENSQAQQKGFSLKEISVALDGIAIAVNPELNISGLTIAQLKDIYTGKITNWKDVGGPNLSIQSLSRSKESGGTVDFFVENVLNKENFGTQVIYISK